MFITIDLKSETPIYKQLEQSIIKGIAKKELKCGEDLPSVRQLAADLGVNMHTVAKAYALLKKGGFISVQRNKGALVNAPQDYAADEKYLSELKRQIKEHVTQAYCRGLSQQDWLGICADSYKDFVKKENKK